MTDDELRSLVEGLAISQAKTEVPPNFWTQS